MKIAGFNTLNSTLVVKFCSDLAEKPIDDYPEHEINVVELDDGVTLDQILAAIAQSGWTIAMQQEVAEQTAKNSEKVAIFKSLIDSQYMFTEDELYPKSCGVAENQPKSTGLMEI
jgi:hypothetical protein